MPRPKPTIETYTDLKKALSRVFYKVEEGKIDAKIGNVCGYIAQILAGVLAGDKDSSGPKLPTPLEVWVRGMNESREAKGLPKDEVGGSHPLPCEHAPQEPTISNGVAK